MIAYSVQNFDLKPNWSLLYTLIRFSTVYTWANYNVQSTLSLTQGSTQYKVMYKNNTDYKANGNSLPNSKTCRALINDTALSNINNEFLS